MRVSLLCLSVFALAILANAQQSTDILATANGKNYTSADLSPDTRRLLGDRNEILANTRKQLINKMISDHLIEIEARSKGVPPEELVAGEKAKAQGPTEAQINAVFEANREALGDKTPAEARKQVVEFLRREPEDAAVNKYVETLAAKYKPAIGKDINAVDLKPQETIFTVGTRSFTASEFDKKYKLVLYDSQCDILDRVTADLEDTVYLSLVAAEGRSLGMDPGELIAKEVTNKMKEFTEEERAVLENALRRRLFAKYNAKFLIKYPPPIVQDISIAGSPARGSAAAPVTVVMFSDFQCPACSATHPLLEKVLAEYGDKVRFVVRDFPLTTLHPDAYRAARAAWAANAQGKFFEYTEVLYKNQSALDDASLSTYAAGLGLNVKRFELDLSSENAAAAVTKDVADGTAYGITGTPTIFVNGAAVRRLSIEGFREAINAALNKK